MPRTGVLARGARMASTPTVRRAISSSTQRAPWKIVASTNPTHIETGTAHHPP